MSQDDKMDHDDRGDKEDQDETQRDLEPPPMRRGVMLESHVSETQQDEEEECSCLVDAALFALSFENRLVLAASNESWLAAARRVVELVPLLDQLLDDTDKDVAALKHLIEASRLAQAAAQPKLYELYNIHEAIEDRLVVVLDAWGLGLPTRGC